MNYVWVFVVTFICVFLLTTLISRYLIPVLKSKKMGQKILDIGPRWHKSKEGTPTMGGLAFLFSVCLVGAVFCIVYALSSHTDSTQLEGLCFALALGFVNGMIGIIDDLTKFKKAKNEGLTPPQKFFLQVLFAALYLFGIDKAHLLHRTVSIPFTSVVLDLGIFYYLIALILITGIVNSVNLTDGIDGLCSMVTFVVGLFFFVCGIALGLREVALSALGGMICGACAGFLVYNFYPARVFMGDTGSLFLGGLVAGGAFLLDEPMVIIIAGIIYIAESLSVIIQVGSFKLTGKRVFKMSPIHHNFEKCDWSEIKIDVVFTIVSVFAAAIAFLMLR